MQRLDDRTGVVIPEHMQERQTQRDWMFGQIVALSSVMSEVLAVQRKQDAQLQTDGERIQALVEDHNRLYARVTELEAWRSEFALEIKPAIWRELGLLDDKIVDLRYVPIWRRVWAMVAGR